MRQGRERWLRGTLCCLLGMALLFGLVGVPIGSSTTGAVESDGNVTVYRASNVSFGSEAGVGAAIANGTVEPARVVAVEDTLVVAIESDRLVDAMTAANGSTTARFFTALDRGAEFRIVQTNPTTNANRKVALLGRENVTVHRNATTVYAVVETEDLSIRYRRVRRPTEIDAGDRFAVQFGYDLPDTLSRATTPEGPIIEFQPRSQLTTVTTVDRPTTATTDLSTTTARTSSEASGEERTTATRTSSESSTSSPTLTTREQGSSTEGDSGRPGASGVPGFGVPAVLVALLVLAMRWT